jgi:hypothetical protein
MGSASMSIVLSDVQRLQFERDGILKLEAAFDRRDAARMCDVMWNELRHRYGIERSDPSTWSLHPPTGLRSSKKSSAFDAILGPAVQDALDDLFGPGQWARPKTLGNVLVTMPNATSWRVPHKIWHSDFEATAPRDRLFAVKLWALCRDLPPGGGGTPQLAGSHRLFSRYLAGDVDLEYKAAKHGFLRSHPWLKELTRDDGTDVARNEHHLEEEVDIDGLPVRVVELTGNAGDVFVTHAWVFHSIAVNASDQPRLMRSAAVRESQSPPSYLNETLTFAR